MALIHCPECGWEVSSKAKVCPKCGYPLQIGKSAPLGTGITKLRFFKRVFVIVLIFVVLLILTPIILSVSKKASFTFSPEDLQQSVETINIVDYPITINGIEVVNVLNSISLNAFSQTGNTNDYTIYSSSLENCIINLVYDGNGNVVLYNTHLIAGSDGEAERNLSADFYAFAGYMKMINKNASPYEICNTYAEIKNVLEVRGIEGIDGALLDIGVSSFQLDNIERGFSYMHDAPLDMRMNQEDSFTAYDVINRYSRKELTRVIKEYGEEKWAGRIAEFIVNSRKSGDIRTTGQLVEIIKAAIPASARRDGPHPAKRTFQAVRIEVNSELEQIRTAVDEFCDVLNPGGRLCIITFHSLEDRIVKEAFNRRLDPCTCPPEFPVCVCGKVSDTVKVTGKPITPSEAELMKNPRSRSAKLRVIEKKR